MRTRSKLAFVSGLAFLFALSLLAAAVLSQDSLPEVAVAGQSETILPDGNHLLLGGVDSLGSFASGSLLNVETGSVVPLASNLKFARAWHTATVLADGTVAVIGGVGKHGKTISVWERFVPESQSFDLISVSGVTARSHHTTTLLSDGSVLIVGGRSASGETLADAQLWDPRTNQTTSVPGGMSGPRRDHSAILQSDGTVLISGGTDGHGTKLKSAERYDPRIGGFSSESQQPSALNLTGGSAGPPAEASTGLAGTIPADGATNVSPATIISLRFDYPMQVETINTETITLAGPGGQIAAGVVAAESGRLAFVNPDSQLAPNTRYTVSVDRVVARDGAEMAPTSFSFTTGSSPVLSGPGGSGSGGSGSPGSGSGPGLWIPTSDWRTHLPPSRWQSLPPLRAPQGVTALSGQVLTIDGSPLRGVTLQVGAYSAHSDGTGRFLIAGLPAGLDALLIDGTSANQGGISYGIFQPGVSVTAKVTNVLPFTIWMPVLDTPHAVTIPVPTTAETVAVSPLIPGLELHLPTGSEIRDVNGQLAHAVTITPIPLDRPPFPLPSGVVVPIYFTIQPGLAKIQTPSGGRAGAWLVYPNTGKLPVGASFNFWDYGLSWGGWWVYGHGAVGAGGAQIFPNPGVSFETFTGAMVGSAQATNTHGCGSGAAGDPVDCSTGIFIYSERDLRLADVIPLDFQRTYLTQDSQSRPFGIGFTDNYEVYLTTLGNPLYTNIFLILPDGEEVAYTNTYPDKSDFRNANFVPTLTSEPAYYGSTITFDPDPNDTWILRLKNGTKYTFPDSMNFTLPSSAAVDSITDRYGNTVTISRGYNRNLTQITSPNGRYIQFQFDSNNRITQATDNLGRTVTYTYDSYSASGRPTCNSTGMLCAVTDANGGVTSYTYDGGNRMLTVTDPRGNTQITNTYDPTSGRATAQTLADGTSTYQFGYTLNGNSQIIQSNVTDPNGNTEIKYFDNNGFLTSDVQASGSSVAQTFTFARDPGTELITSMTDPLERQTTYAYDNNGNLTGITKLAGTSQAVSTAMTYDPTFNQLTSITDPLTHTWTFGRDGRGNLTSITDPLNHPISLTYDTEGRPSTLADANNDTTRFSYNGADLASITDPLGNTTNRYSDSAGRLVWLGDALGQSTVITQDALDRITGITDPNSSASSFAYDANGNLLSVTDANSNQTSFAYDSRNRVTSRADGLMVSESYAYDANSNLTSHTDRRGKVTAFQYDALNRRTFAGFGQSGSNYESTISYAWDGGNRLTGATDSIAGTITRVPDLLDRITSETTPQGSITYGYDNANRRSTMQVAGQAQVSYTWDNANRLTGITQGSSVVGISYDNANRRTSLTLPNGVTVGYSFDNDSRITGLTYSAGSSQLGNLAYGYDADGRVTTKGGTLAATGLPTSVTGNTFNADNGMTGFGGASLSYDANGNLTSDGTNTYTWDARNNLTAISGRATASFVYDPFGRRASKSIASTTTNFLYDGLNPVQELQAGTPNANLLTGLNIDEFFTRTDASSNVSTLLRDALGSTIGLVGSGQSIGTSYTYQPFGATTAAGAANGNSYQFTGREDDGTGLYFYRARYYHPTLQRFIAQDPIGFASGDISLYNYALNDPIRGKDPFGLGTLIVAIGGGAQAGWGPTQPGQGGGSGSVGIGISYDNGQVEVGLVTSKSTVTSYYGAGAGDNVSVAYSPGSLQSLNSACSKQKTFTLGEPIGVIGGAATGDDGSWEIDVGIGGVSSAAVGTQTSQTTTYTPQDWVNYINGK